MNLNSQIDNLIAEYSVEQKLIKKINEWIHLFRSKLLKLDPLTAIELNNTNVELLNEIKCPLSDEFFNYFANNNAPSFLFQAPKLQVIGSYALKCNARKNNDNLFEIDLLLEIPKQCWQKKDYQDYVYHYKRAFYLAYIAKHLVQFNDIILGAQFRYFNGDPLKPCIYIVPSGPLTLSYRFNILAAPALDKSFVFKNFHPNKCNIQNLNLPSTPFYNQAILSDLTLIYFEENIVKIIQNLPNVKASLILIRIWLDKRNLRSQFAHLITVFTCYLLKNNSLNSKLPPLQIFETILTKISKFDWKSKPLLFNLDKAVDNELCNEKVFSINFFEISSNLNLCYDLSIGDYDRFKIECENSLKFLSSKKLQIDKIFRTPIDFDLYFDISINISVDNVKKQHLKNDSFYNQCGFDLYRSILPEFYQLFNLACGDRFTLIQHKDYRIKDCWNLEEKAKSFENNHITFGLQVNGDNFLNIITKGPIANQPEAANFRELWQEKSEIRKFQNGDIRETVLWNCNTIEDRRHIIIDALKHVFNRKMGLKLSAVTTRFNYFDEMLKFKNIKFNDETFYYGTGEEGLAAINKSLDGLKKKIYNLQLPFKIIDFYSVDSSSRLTDTFPPLSINSNKKFLSDYCNIFDEHIIEDRIKYVRPINLVIKIDVSGTLPNDLEVYKNRKSLFYGRLSSALSNTCSLNTKVEPSFLDVYFEGFVFRIVLFAQKELPIYQLPSINGKRSRKMVKNAEMDRFEYEVIVLPAISGAINTLNCDNSSYSLTTRLFKRWISRLMIKHFFEEITLDLLVAYCYKHYEQLYPSSNSHFSGFLRLLDFLANFDYVKNFILLNFNNGLSEERIAIIRENFVSKRSDWPALFIVTPYDRKLSFHTRSTPENYIMSYLKKLAKLSLDAFRLALTPSKPLDIKSIMPPNMDMFDIIIKLNSKLLLNKHQSMDFPDSITIKHTLFLNDEKHAMPITNYNPPYIYLSSLKRSYNSVALFFYDEFGGKEIGVLMRPKAFDKKPFSSSTANEPAKKLSALSHSGNTDNLELDLNLMIEDFQIIGENIVETVIVKINQQ